MVRQITAIVATWIIEFIPFLLAGLTNYEVRGLNDEINKIMREERHWENQIVALGGANYRRNVAMLDDDGKEVPGTKGYKYVSANCSCNIVNPIFSPSDILDALKTSPVSVNCFKAGRMKRKRKTRSSHTTRSL